MVRVQENYFFELSKYSKAVQEHCRAEGRVQPERAKNEVLAWIEDGCRCPLLRTSCCLTHGSAQEQKIPDRSPSCCSMC
jgi:hypothetical protein